MDLSPEMLAAGRSAQRDRRRRKVNALCLRTPLIWSGAGWCWGTFVPSGCPSRLSGICSCLQAGWLCLCHRFSTPTPIAAGHRRTFTAPDGTVHDIEHYVHNNHLELAREAGLSAVSSWDGVVGPSIRHFYANRVGLKPIEGTKD